MAKSKALSTVSRLIWGRQKTAPSLQTERLDQNGFEVLDPVPNAVTLDMPVHPSQEERIRAIMRTDFIKRNPDFGLNSNDPEDFGPEANDPLFEFEKRHDRLMAQQKELAEAQEALEATQKQLEEEVKEKRRKAYLEAQKLKATPPPKEPDVTTVTPET